MMTIFSFIYAAVVRLFAWAILSGVDCFIYARAFVKSIYTRILVAWIARGLYNDNYNRNYGNAICEDNYNRNYGNAICEDNTLAEERVIYACISDHDITHCIQWYYWMDSRLTCTSLQMWLENFFAVEHIAQHGIQMITVRNYLAWIHFLDIAGEMDLISGEDIRYGNIALDHLERHALAMPAKIDTTQSQCNRNE